MRIAIAADHAGFELKSSLITYLEKTDHEVTDFGTSSPESTDYPDYVHPMVQAVLDESNDFGIAICGSGNGVCMTANKYISIRAAMAWNEELAKLARQHNNANVLCLPSRFIDTATAVAAVNAFMDTEFEGGRHQRRIEKISPVSKD